MAQKLFVRYADKNDTQAVFDFYAAHQHEYVVSRDPEVWKERIASGAVTIIEDATGKIVAAAISYPLTDKDANGNDVHRWTEIGSVRVGLPGAGLFNALVSAQVMRAYLLEPPDDRFVLEIMKNNQHSKHVFGKAGAAPLEIPQALRDKVLATIAPEDKNNAMDWFQMGIESMPAIARMMLDCVNNPAREEYTLDYSRCAVVQHFRGELTSLAAENLGDPKQPDAQKTIGQHVKARKP